MFYNHIQRKKLYHKTHDMAEIDMSLGAEHEKHLITKASCVLIPANLPHRPLNLRKAALNIR